MCPLHYRTWTREDCASGEWCEWRHIFGNLRDKSWKASMIIAHWKTVRSQESQALLKQPSQFCLTSLTGLDGRHGSVLSQHAGYIAMESDCSFCRGLTRVPHSAGLDIARASEHHQPWSRQSKGIETAQQGDSRSIEAFCILILLLACCIFAIENCMLLSLSGITAADHRLASSWSYNILNSWAAWCQQISVNLKCDSYGYE